MVTLGEAIAVNLHAIGEAVQHAIRGGQTGCANLSSATLIWPYPISRQEFLRQQQGIMRFMCEEISPSHVTSANSSIPTDETRGVVAREFLPEYSEIDDPPPYFEFPPPYECTGNTESSSNSIREALL